MGRQDPAEARTPQPHGGALDQSVGAGKGSIAGRSRRAGSARTRCVNGKSASAITNTTESRICMIVSGMIENVIAQRRVLERGGAVIGVTVYGTIT